MTEEFWIERGRTYLENFNKKTIIQRVRYLIQEQVIIGALNKVRRELNPGTILDAGCGFGRITRILCRVFPFSKIYGIDISEDQLREARSRLKRVKFRRFNLTMIDRVIRSDLAIAVEVLMHIAPADIEDAVSYLTRGGRSTVITVDWWTEDENDIRLADLAGFCYLHFYEALFGMNGFELVREKKIPGVHQKLRVWRRCKNDE